MSNIKELMVYCYKAKLKHVNQDDYFEVPFTVLAEDYIDARSKLEDWLKNPSQTGFKFEKCVGYISMPSQPIIVDMEYIQSKILNKEYNLPVKRLLEENSKLKKSNRNWRRKCQRLKAKLYGEQNDC